MQQPLYTCINGRFLPENEAMLPVTDRGFRFGDGVFETIRIENGAPYQWALHLQRLKAGVSALRIPTPRVNWEEHTRELLSRNNFHEGYLRLSISRGSGSRGYMPEFSATPNWVMETIPAHSQVQAPSTLWLGSYTRAPLTTLPGNNKLSQGVTSTLALLEAREHDCDEALMLTVDGTICSAASANLFWITGNTIYTPALGTGCLAGTTRAAVMRLMQVTETIADLNDIAAAQCVFISNVRLGVWPVATLAPNNLHFDVAHPIFLDISKRLRTDRATAHTDWILNA